MPDPRRLFGNSGEARAAKYLKNLGMKILARQYKTHIGEIDLVAMDGDEIVFVEVKTRRGTEFGYPEESVTPKKLQKIAMVAEQYVREKKEEGRAWRVDVVAITTGEQDEVHYVKGVG